MSFQTEFLFYLDRQLFPLLDRSDIFRDLDPEDRGNHLLLDCPECGKRRAVIPKTGFVLVCPRPKGCGHVVSLIAHAAEVPFPRGKEFLGALKTLAESADGEFYPQKISQEELVWAAEKDRRFCLLESFFDYAKALARDEKKSGDLKGRLSDMGFPGSALAGLEFGFYPGVEEVKEVLHKSGCYLLTGEDLGFFQPKWEGRVVFPWRDLLGRLVNAVGVMGDDRVSLDWVNPEKPFMDAVIPFDGEDVPFGLYEGSLRNARDLLLVRDPLRSLRLRSLLPGKPFPVACLRGEPMEQQTDCLIGFLSPGGTLTVEVGEGPGNLGAGSDVGRHWLNRIRSAGVRTEFLDAADRADGT